MSKNETHMVPKPKVPPLSILNSIKKSKILNVKGLSFIKLSDSTTPYNKGYRRKLLVTWYNTLQ